MNCNDNSLYHFWFFLAVLWPLSLSFPFFKKFNNSLKLFTFGINFLEDFSISNLLKKLLWFFKRGYDPICNLLKFFLFLLIWLHEVAHIVKRDFREFLKLFDELNEIASEGHLMQIELWHVQGVALLCCEEAIYLLDFVCFLTHPWEKYESFLPEVCLIVSVD